MQQNFPVTLHASISSFLNREDRNSYRATSRQIFRHIGSILPCFEIIQNRAEKSKTRERIESLSQFKRVSKVEGGSPFPAKITQNLQSSSSSSSSPQSPISFSSSLSSSYSAKPTLSLGSLRIYKNGYANLEISAQKIHITHMDCSLRGQGAGTALIRQVMEMAFENEVATITATASWKSNQHIFHLKMGMIPDDREIPYIENFFGYSGLDAIRALKDSYPDDYELGVLERILRKVENKPETEKISESQIIKKSPLLIRLLDKKCSYLRDSFMHTLLYFLENNKKSATPSRFPDSSCFGPVNMTMSDQGKERWRRDFKDGVAFRSFQFEHLRPYMSDAQTRKLDELLL